MASRKLSVLELKIHQTALTNNEKLLSQKDLVALAPDASARTEALNFLLGTGMLKALTHADGRVSAYRAVMKNEMDVKKDMSGEEVMVLSHIQAAGNKGIWTKHLKAKTELHQTVIDRCLKSLLQKQLVKVVKSVEHRTRKMYMLSHLEPAIELTGGPWYTDNELDTEFIKNLYDTILHYIREHSFPKQKNNHSASLYAISSAPSYPTAQQIQIFLTKSKITDTRLTIEHVEMLLNILMLDGEVEKIPSFGAALWEPNMLSDAEDEAEKDTPRKRRRDSDNEKHRKRRKDHTDSDDEGTRRRKSNRRRKRDAMDTSDDNHQPKKGGKKRKVNDESGDANPKGKKKSKPKSRFSPDSEPSSTSSSDPGSADDESSPRKPSRKRSMSPIPPAGLSSETMDAFQGAHVYRAVRQEHIALGWSQAPCGRCPVFDFCKQEGPVNPSECTYFEEWFGKDVIKYE